MEDNKKTIMNPDEELKLLLAKALVGDSQNEDEELEVNWVGLLQKLIHGWKTIFLVTFMFSVLGVGFAFMQKKEYTVTVSLSPESGTSNTTSTLGGMANLLGLGNVSAGNTAGALSMSMFPEISVSTPFLTSLFDVEVTPFVGSKEQLQGELSNDAVGVFELINKKQNEGYLWKNLFAKDDSKYELLYNDSVINLSILTPRQVAAVVALRKAIVVESDKKTGMTNISVTWEDPLIATQLADTICNRLQDYVIEYRTRKAKEDYDYYSRMSEESKEKMIKAQSAYAASVDFDRSVILQSINNRKERLQAEAQLAAQIYQQMETQKAAAQAKYQELKPVFAVVEPATFPLNPSSKSRKIYVLAFLFAGFCLSSGWVMFGKVFFFDLKQQIQEKKGKA